MNELIKYFNSNQSNLIHKWAHYFDIYDFYFRKFKNKDIYFIEIGVFDGGSLQMWKNYFGVKAHIIGIDINPLAKKLEDDQIKIIIGDQEDDSFLERVISDTFFIQAFSATSLTFVVLFAHAPAHGIHGSISPHNSHAPCPP